MKIDTKFPRQIVLTLAGVSVLAAYPLIRYGSPEVLLAAGAGAALSTLNVLLGFFAIEYAYDKSYTVFLKTVLGGMGIRMVVLLGALAALIMFGRLHAVALTVSLFGFYLVYLILEILFIQKKVLVRNQE